MIDRSDYMLIPMRVLRELVDFAERGIRPGGYVQAVLAEDLGQAVALGDSEVLGSLVQTSMFVFNRMPAGTWGSRSALSCWVHDPPAGITLNVEGTQMEVSGG